MEFTKIERFSIVITNICLVFASAKLPYGQQHIFSELTPSEQANEMSGTGDDYLKLNF